MWWTSLENSNRKKKRKILSQNKLFEIRDKSHWQKTQFITRDSVQRQREKERETVREKDWEWKLGCFLLPPTLQCLCCLSLAKYTIIMEPPQVICCDQALWCSRVSTGRWGINLSSTRSRNWAVTWTVYSIWNIRKESSGTSHYLWPYILSFEMGILPIREEII